MPLNDILQNCSGAAIQGAFERIVRNQIPNKNLIGPRNHFLSDTKSRVDALNKRVNNSGTITVINPLTPKKQRHIEEYVSSSVLVHNSDGWNYLSRSIECLLNGDVASSIHLAYYAELRAVMSIMAFEGLGIFNQQHIWFDADGNAHLFKNFSTHKLADESIEMWANQANRKDVLFEFIRVKNHNLDEWIRETGFSSRANYATSVVNAWLKKWSIDLHIREDQNLRNEMSYRPHFDSSNVDVETNLEKVSEIWELLEPTSSNAFPLLDQHLLRIALEEMYRKSTGRKITRGQFEPFVTSIFGKIGETTSQSLYGFLLRDISPSDPLIIIEAKKDHLNYRINKKDPFPLICRAILLLRLSTGAARNLIEKSTLDKDDLTFWGDEVSFNSGITSSKTSLINPVDLFADIRDSIDEMRGNPPGTFNCVRDAAMFSPDAIFNIKQFQRAGIWGVMA